MGTWFFETTPNGLTKEQLYSTESYQAANLRGIGLGGNDLSGWDLSGQDLTNAEIWTSQLTDTNFTGATVAGTCFEDTTTRGFTQEQLYSTASYQARNLQGVWLGYNDLTGWDFSNQDLTNAVFSESNLTNADFTGAVVAGSEFVVWEQAAVGLTKEQLYSTASYGEKNLQGINLMRNDLSGWNFAGQDLSKAWLLESRLRGADLTGANLRDAEVILADLSNSNLTNVDLNHAVLWDANLANANLMRADLRNADLAGTNLTGINLTGADLRNTRLEAGDGLSSAVVDSTTVYNQWTIFPDGLDPIAAGLTMRPSPAGDFDANDELNATDLELLMTFRVPLQLSRDATPESRYDLNEDGWIDIEDLRVWVSELKGWWFGDANLDGEFSSTDLTIVFEAGKYERGWLDKWGRPVGESADWSEGDWNGDNIFNSSDIVLAFVDGGYEQGPRASVSSVPEPATIVAFLTGVSMLAARDLRRKR